MQLALRWGYNPALDHFSEEDKYPDKPPNQLLVALVQGRKLPAMDRKVISRADDSGVCVCVCACVRACLRACLPAATQGSACSTTRGVTTTVAACPCCRRRAVDIHRELFGGGMTSDPLATLRCGGQRATSPVVKGSVDPWWNHVFKLPVDDDETTLMHHSLEVDRSDMTSYVIIGRVSRDSKRAAVK